MTSRTRYFVIVSLLVLAVGVGTGLVAYYVGIPFGDRRGAFEELRLMPRDAAVVAYANVREVMTSELRQRVKQALPIPQDGQREFEDQTGINIETDIDRVVACFEAGSGGGRQGSPLVLARGRFNEVKIEALMRDHGGEVEDYKGTRLVVAAAPATPPVATPRPGTPARPGLHRARTRCCRGAQARSLGGRFAGFAVCGGDSKQAERAAAPNNSVVGNQELMDQIGALDNANAWVVGRFDALRLGSLPPAVAERLPAITLFSLSGHVDGGFNGVLRAETKDDEAGNNLRDVIRGFMALAKLQAGSNPQFQTMIQSLVLGGSGKTVALSFSLPAEAFDALGALRQRREIRP